MDNRPIAVFDSGIGGLTVLKEIIEQLPGEDIVYLGDTARIPYGSRSKETVIKYVREAIDFLLTKDIKAIVIACNTATALALEEMKEEFKDIPIIGVVEPGALAAATSTKNNIIGVIGTDGTINSLAYQRSIRKHLPRAEIIGVPCPLFVPIVEEGWENSDVAYIASQKYLLELKEHNIDTLVLGCTHYPAMRYTISKVMDGVHLVNPAYETAKLTRNILKEKNLLSEKLDSGLYDYYVTDDPDKFKRIGGNIIRKQIAEVLKIDISK